jgi:hypothetical protein
MKNISLRNILILVAAIIGALLLLGVVGTLVNQIAPITVALIVGVVLGRMSASVDLLASLKSAIRREKQETKSEPVAATPQQSDTAEDEIQAGVEAIKRRIADEPEAAPEQAEPSDFEIKTEEQILAEARQREAEIARQTNAYDPAAALEERRRRLLGDQADDS